MNKLSYFILSTCLIGTMIARESQSNPISLDDRIALDDAIVFSSIYIREVAIPVIEVLAKEVEKKKDVSCRMAADFYAYLPTDWIDDDRNYNAQADFSQRSCTMGRESVDALLQRGSLDAFSKPIFLTILLPLEQKMQQDHEFSDKAMELMRNEVWSDIRYEDKPTIKRNLFPF